MVVSDALTNAFSMMSAETPMIVTLLMRKTSVTIMVAMDVPPMTVALSEFKM